MRKLEIGKFGKAVDNKYIVIINDTLSETFKYSNNIKAYCKLKNAIFILFKMIKIYE